MTYNLALKKDFPRRDNRFIRSQIRNEIERFNRGPFMDMLASAMQVRPDLISMYEWACTNPDKWANMCATLAKLAGFNDESTVNVNSYHMIADLSDAQLLQRLTEMRRLPPQLEHQPSAPKILEDCNKIATPLPTKRKRVKNA